MPVRSVQLRLIRSADGICVGQLSTTIDRNAPGDAALKLSSELITLLHKEAGVPLRSSATLYQVPSGAYLSEYLLRLEQLLAVRCASMKECNSESLYGEREIIDGNLRLCLSLPANVAVRILLTQTLAAMKKVRPAMVAEFGGRIMLLQKEQPLAEPAQATVQLKLDEVLAA